jgi:hypothetical protein
LEFVLALCLSQIPFIVDHTDPANRATTDTAEWDYEPPHPSKHQPALLFSHTAFGFEPAESGP